MSELDDLLGPTPAAAAAAEAFDADPLGDDGGGRERAVSSGAALEASTPGAAVFEFDDLLGAGSDPLQSSAGDATASTTTTTAAAAAAPAESPTSPTSGAGARPRMVAPITVPVVGELSPALQPFVTKTTYFARFVSLMDSDRRRVRRVVTVTDSQIYVLTEDRRAERSVSVDAVIGVVVQHQLVSRRLGLSKELEEHVLIQVRGEPDVFFSLPRDEQNGAVAASLDIVRVVSGLCLAFGNVLPVSTLRENESMDAILKWGQGDTALRRSNAEALAFRTLLSNELTESLQRTLKLDTALSALRASSGAQATRDLNQEIQGLERAVAELALKSQHLDTSQAETAKVHSRLVAELATEDARRAAAVRETVELSAQEVLGREFAEYEILRSAHKRDVDRVAAIIAINEMRMGHRAKLAPAAAKPVGDGDDAAAAVVVTYSGVSELSRRIDELGDEEALVNERRVQGGEQQAAKVRALGTAKKRLAQAKEVLAGLLEEINLVKTTAATEPLPPHITDAHAPTFDPVAEPAAAPRPVFATSQAAIAAAAAAGNGGGGGAPAPVAAASAKPAINLDDEDDEI